MTKEKIEDLYFMWLYRLVCGEDESRIELCRILHSIPFEYSLGMDGNREADGIDIRYRFGYENGYADYVIAAYIDILPCSVFEMMVALANRCEEQIMSDPEKGNRTHVWFSEMLKNLGLYNETNDVINDDRVHKVIFRFLDRKYERNGKSGLFTVNNRKDDMRNVEIWYQMMFWLDEQEEL